MNKTDLLLLLNVIILFNTLICKRLRLFFLYINAPCKMITKTLFHCVHRQNTSNIC